MIAAVKSAAERPELSVVVPFYNEAENVASLHTRLVPVLEQTGKSFEIVYVDDGSRDGTTDILRRLQSGDSRVRVIIFNRNYGQHAAVAGGLDRARGDVVVTLDGDLQNPPEEIPKLLQKIDEGYDVVGGWRQQRHDSALRLLSSRAVNRIASRIVGVEMKDYGCMMRAYRRSVVDHLRGGAENSSFMPALANTFAGSVAEVPISHAPRRAGASKYSLLRLLRINFDLITGFSLLPVQIVGIAGAVATAVGAAAALVVCAAWLFSGGPIDRSGIFFAIVLFFIGVQILGIALIGEYIGRIYIEVRGRPRYIVREILE
jgi:undecaprenyl-phosphate 4-deoxy-4-formamido-L-arabinose transferase